jgi:Ala-tRNA(Pro) deacylase
MAIAIQLQDYLTAQGIAYDVVTHPRAMTMLEAARRATVPSDCVAKAVVLEDDDGYMLAVVPASRVIKFSRLRRLLDRRLGIATEPEIATLFADCDLGAIPATGAAYGLTTILDDSLAEQPDVYLEGGDHCSLVHISGADFRRLMAEAPHGRFSSPPGSPQR